LEAYDEQRQAVSVVITGTVRPAHAIAWKENPTQFVCVCVCVCVPCRALSGPKKQAHTQKKTKDGWCGEMIH
jgi:hypothetical protein